jgi:protein-glutamine gamma-glutamyltransferase
MNLLASYRVMVLWCVLLVCVAYSIADLRPWIGIAAASMCVINWMVQEVWRRPRAGMPAAAWASGAAAPLPRALVYGVVGLVLSRGAYQAWTEGLRVSTFCEFVVLVLLVKIWDRRTARDYSQILTLCFFLAIGAMLTDVRLASSAIVVIALPLLLATVMKHQIVAARERAGIGARPEDSPSASDITGGAAWRLRAVATVCLVIVLAVSVVVFLVMPRASPFGDAGIRGAWNIRQNSPQTGFTDRVQLGQAGLISESNEVVAEVMLEDEKGQPVRSQNDVWYLRGAVLDEYQDGVWFPSDRIDGTNARGAYTGRGVWDNVPMLPNSERSIGKTRSDRPRVITQRIRLLNAGRMDTPIFSVWRPQSVKFSDDSTLRVHRHNGVLRRNGSAGSFEYTVKSAISDEFTRFDPQADPDGNIDRGRSSWVSFPSRIVRDETERILRNAGVEPDPALRPMSEDARAARLIENYLRRNFSYTLDIPAPSPGMDPVEWFLIEGKRGHCSYFAAAMTAMVRSIGIPARMISGYAAAEVDLRTGGLIVRERNAHAWVEAQVGLGAMAPDPSLTRKPGYENAYAGWRTYDPTPPDTLRELHESTPGLATAFSRILDSIEFAWNSTVVSYDERQRTQFFRRQGIDIPRAEQWLARLPQRLRGDGSDEPGSSRRSAAAPWIFAGGLMIVGGALLFLIMRAPRRTRAAHNFIDWPPYYTKMLRETARLGASKPDWMPPLEFFTLEPSPSPSALAPETARAAREIAEAAYAERLGGVPHDQLAPRVRAALDVLARA